MVDPAAGLRGRHLTRFLPDLKLPCAHVLAWRMALARAGHGKTQCAVQAQYLIGRFPSAALVVCVDAAGSLDPNLSVGDVVVGTETVEHDYRLLFATKPLPRFRGDIAALMRLRGASAGLSGFRIAFDVIASGDEDVVSSSRAAEIQAQTGAVCVAWEGSGAARAAAFNNIGSLEIRGITDAANKEAPQDFHDNLPIAMANLFRLLEVLLTTESRYAVCQTSGNYHARAPDRKRILSARPPRPSVRTKRVNSTNTTPRMIPLDGSV